MLLLYNVQFFSVSVCYLYVHEVSRLLIDSPITENVLPPPAPSADPEDTSGFPIALIIVPLLIFIIIIVIVTAIIIHWRWKKRHSGRAKIAPVDDDSNTERDTKKSIFDGEDGIHLTRAESLKILSTKGSFDEEEDGIQVTRTKSLTVIVPPGQFLCIISISVHKVTYFDLFLREFSWVKKL